MEIAQEAFCFSVQVSSNPIEILNDVSGGRAWMRPFYADEPLTIFFLCEALIWFFHCG